MKILIADDEPLARERLIRLLKKIPHSEIVEPCAENGQQALEQVAQYKPDILLLDIGMPGLDGLRLFFVPRMMSMPCKPLQSALLAT